MALRIADARWPDDRAIVEALFREYAASLAEDIGFQNVDDELSGLPGQYARPTGVGLIARAGADAAGAGAYRQGAPGGEGTGWRGVRRRHRARAGAGRGRGRADARGRRAERVAADPGVGGARSGAGGASDRARLFGDWIATDRAIATRTLPDLLSA